MREYDETTLKVAERVFEKGDEILAQRQKRAAVIRHRTYAVSGLCAAVIVCFGAWRLSSSVKVPHDGSEIIASTETTSAISSTVELTTTITTVEKGAVSSTTVSGSVIVLTSVKTEKSDTHTTTAAATVSIATQTVSTTAAATTPHRTTAFRTTTATAQTTNVRETQTPVSTTVITTVVPTGRETAVTISPEENYNPVQTSAAVCTISSSSYDMVVTTRSTSEKIEELDFKEVFRTNPATVEVKTSKLNYYEKQNVLLTPDRIDKRRIYVSDVHITQPNGLPMLIGMEVYDIIDISREKAVAVKLRDTEEYYLFKNPDVKAEELYS